MKVSIITVCKNSASHIEKAIKSVLNQTYSDCQYIIIDGHSNDETLTIVNRYRHDIDIIRSESDTGIYNAMNKALQYVIGDVVYFLNSDDCLYDSNVISDFADEFKANSQDMVVYGNVVSVFNAQEKLIRFPDVDGRYFYQRTICHQAVFTRRELFERVGEFNESYPIHADADWLMRAFFKLHIRFRHIDRIVCYYSSEGVSSNPVYAEKHKFDRQEISAHYFIEARIKLMIKKLLIRIGFSL